MPIESVEFLDRGDARLIGLDPVHFDHETVMEIKSLLLDLIAKKKFRLVVDL